MNFKENESAIKLRGGYYTEPEIATFLLSWVLQKKPRHILEPSCGNGIFFKCIYDLPHSFVEEFVGFEINSIEAEKARNLTGKTGLKIAEVRNMDFLSWFLSNPILTPQFEAVVGNPPFIRYQYLDPKHQLLSEKIFNQYNLNFTKHTNAWVPFVIASIALLKPGGRLAMVLPSELLHVLHAGSLRNYLTENCSKIMIIDPQEIWFEETLQGAILLLAEKKLERTKPTIGVGIIPTVNKSFLSNDPQSYFEQAEYVNGEVLSGKWMRALLTGSERQILKKALDNENVYKFGDIAEVVVGIVTGANKFFLVPDEIVEKYDLNKWAHPMFGRSEHVPGIIYDQYVHNKNKENGLPSNFIWFTNEEFDDLPERTKEYIKYGELQELHKRYKCRIRDPWFHVPYVYSTSIGMLKRSHNFPRLILNRIEAFTTDTAYRINSKIKDDESLVYSFINSLTALSAELEGRHYGGGVLELVPSEIRKLAIPLVKTENSDLIYLDKQIREINDPEKIMIIQDESILSKINLNNNEIDIIREAWNKLRLRRHRKDQKIN